jgi:hypothetical protein
MGAEASSGLKKTQAAGSELNDMLGAGMGFKGDDLADRERLDVCRG